MFRKKSPEVEEIDQVITEVIKAMDVKSGDYATHEKMLSTLTKLREAKRPWQPCADTVLMTVANVTTALMILKYEKFGVITTKALSFVSKLK